MIKIDYYGEKIINELERIALDEVFEDLDYDDPEQDYIFDSVFFKITSDNDVYELTTKEVFQILDTTFLEEFSFTTSNEFLYLFMAWAGGQANKFAIYDTLRKNVILGDSGEVDEVFFGVFDAINYGNKHMFVSAGYTSGGTWGMPEERVRELQKVKHDYVRFSVAEIDSIQKYTLVNMWYHNSRFPDQIKSEINDQLIQGFLLDEAPVDEQYKKIRIDDFDYDVYFSLKEYFIIINNYKFQLD